MDAGHGLNAKERTPGVPMRQSAKGMLLAWVRPAPQQPRPLVLQVVKIRM